MQVIKQGVSPDNREAHKTCFRCKTEFTYTRADLQSDRDGQYVECPTCKSFIAAKDPSLEEISKRLFGK